MSRCVARRAASLEREMVDFIRGRSDGGQLMLAIYGNVADEPRLALRRMPPQGITSPYC